MRKTVLTGASIIVFFLLSSSATAILSSSYHLKGTLDKDTNAFFIGKTRIDGNFIGIPMKRLFNSSIVQDMKAFPLTGASSITNLDTVIVAEDIDITSVDSLEELYLRYYDHITQYSNVDITTENGLFVLGITNGSLLFSSTLHYAISSFVIFEIIPGMTSRFFLTTTTVPLSMQFSGDFAVLTELSNASTIWVKDAQGKILWSGSSQDNYLIIMDSSFSVTQQPPLFLFPLHSGTSNPPLNLVVTPADQKDITVTHLLEEVSHATASIGIDNTSDFLGTINGLNDTINIISLGANGAVILTQTNDTVAIDRTVQRFSTLGFARFTTLEITNTGASSGPTLEGDCTLIFLGDHLYNPLAKRSADGISFPYELCIIWMIAACVFLSVYFFIRPDVNEDRDDAVKRYALIFHVIFLIVAIVLVDSEINDQFGISAFTALATQGITMVSGMLLFVELIIWVIGYVSLALPLRLLVASGLRFIGIGKGGKGFAKAVGDLSIWIFCVLYVQLIINILLSVFNVSNLISMG